MRISLIGCGKVGITMLYHLKDRHEIIGVHDPDPAARRRAVKLLDVKEPVPYPEFVAKSEAVFIATPDDSIRQAGRRIRRRLRAGALLVHFSGLLPAEVLPGAKSVRRAAVHPFASFPRLVIPPPRRIYPLFVQADARTIGPLRRLFDRRHFTVIPVPSRDKPRLHLMGVMSSNLLVSLLDAAAGLAPAGPERNRIFRRAVRPLIDETLRNLDRAGFREALSGPVRRGDLRTVREHLRRLRNDPELGLIYRALSLHIVKFAPPKKKKALKGLLSG